jgi:hypothetical protein
MKVPRYLGYKEIGDLFGVYGSTVSKWRTRYSKTDHPCPEPDVWIGDTPGWANSAVWKAWRVTLPGQGAGGGPLPTERARRELAKALAAAEREHPGSRHNDKRALLHIAASYGVDKRTAMAIWSRVADERNESPMSVLDQYTIAHVIRGRKRLQKPNDEQPQSTPAEPQ